MCTAQTTVKTSLNSGHARLLPVLHIQCTKADQGRPTIQPAAMFRRARTEVELKNDGGSGFVKPALVATRTGREQGSVLASAGEFGVAFKAKAR